MSILQQIEADTKTAMVQKDSTTLSVLRMLKSSLHNKSIEAKGAELSDDEVITVLKSEAKKRNDAIEAYTDGGRAELADKEKAELAVIEKYLPAQLDDAALQVLITEVQGELGEAAQFGAVMKGVMARAGAQADGKRVSALVKAALGT